MSSVKNVQDGNEESSFSKPKKVANKREENKPFKLSNENENGSGEDLDDPCVKKEAKEKKSDKEKVYRNVGLDPRFQQQNQALRCFVSYIDFFRCKKILGEGHEACGWFQDSYNTFCPLKWIENFDEAREEGRFPWHRRDQGKFPGDKYG